MPENFNFFIYNIIYVNWAPLGAPSLVVYFLPIYYIDGMERYMSKGKVLFAVISVAVTAILVSACSSGGGETATSPANSEAETEPRDCEFRGTIYKHGEYWMDGVQALGCAYGNIIPGGSCGDCLDNYPSSSALMRSSSSVMVESSSSFQAPAVVKGTMTDSRDGHIYKTVTIGTQTWMAENLNYFDQTRADILSDYVITLEGLSWCSDGATTADCAVGGRLYTWAAAIDSIALFDGGDGMACGYRETCTLPAKVQGVCPPGWHLPTYTEWSTLLTAVGGQAIAGTSLKSQTGWNDGGNGTDAVGFAVLPVGYRSYYEDAINPETFRGAGGAAGFWSATEYENNSMSAYSLYLDSIHEKANLTDYYKNFGFSVRCIQD